VLTAFSYGSVDWLDLPTLKKESDNVDSLLLGSVGWLDPPTFKEESNSVNGLSLTSPKGVASPAVVALAAGVCLLRRLSFAVRVLNLSGSLATPQRSPPRPCDSAHGSVGM